MRLLRLALCIFFIACPRDTDLTNAKGEECEDMATRAPLIVPAVRRHTASVIWAHGLGDSGAGWLPVAENFRLRNKFDEVKFIFPNAPNIPITINFGMQMPGWHDIRSFDKLEDAANDEPGIRKSYDYLQTLIKAEIDAGIPESRVVIGGFSQGGAIAIYSGLVCPHKLAGIFGLSSYLLLPEKIKELSKDGKLNKEVPVFMGHGDSDPVVQYRWGQLTAHELKQAGCDVTLHTYPGLVHSADAKEMDDLEAFLKERLPPQP